MRRISANSIKRSAFEDAIALDLDNRGIKYGYESKLFRYFTEHGYRPDFVFTGAKLVVEAKGYFTPSDRSKLIAVRPVILDAGWRIALLFQRATNKLHRLSPTTYAEWCDRHGFEWAEGTIPDSWLIKKE